MHHGYDEYELRFDCVENRVWKNVCKTTANIFINHPPASRRIENSVNRTLNFINKS